MNKMERENVYKLIDNEREYQDEKWPNQRSVAEELLIMQKFLDKSRTSYTSVLGQSVALDQIRKVVAIGVRCLENHSNGIVRR